MKIRVFLVAVLSLPGYVLLAQTKKIAFESHSGRMEYFKTAGSNGFFDNEESDFGLPVPKEIKTYKLDTVIFLADTASVLIKKEYSRGYSEPRTSAKFVQSLKDTLYHHPLFTRQHSLDSIKTVLKKEAYYINFNYINKVVFIGYDNKKTPGLQKKRVPLILLPDKPVGHSPFDRELLLMLGALLFLSLLGGWLSWRFYQPRLQ